MTKTSTKKSVSFEHFKIETVEKVSFDTDIHGLVTDEHGFIVETIRVNP
jgi:hypothetical protein